MIRLRILLITGLSLLALTFGLMTLHKRQQESLKNLREERVRFDEQMRTTLQRDRKHYEAIIRVVERQSLKMGERRRFAFPKAKTPDDMQPLEESFEQADFERFCDENTVIFAWRPADGMLRAIIVVRERGDAGTYSLFYTGKVLSEDQLIKGQSRVFTQLDPNWWSVVDYE